jgi:adenosylmethionine-8-amino-7-oxononanoate aminotransferase
MATYGYDWWPIQMTHNFPRHSKITPPVAIAGAGCYITDSTGKEYFDGSGGAAVSCLGHGDADIAAAMKDQIDKLSFAHTSFFTSPPAEALANLLIVFILCRVDQKPLKHR